MVGAVRFFIHLLTRFQRMAPECMMQQEYGAKSDVWALGVVMWEIFSGGAVPYEDMSPAQVAMAVTMDGLRLDQPKGCSDAVYALMLSWYESD